MMTPGDGPFIAYCRCAAVTYEGRASSVLAPGRYLIVRKGDGSVAVHAGVAVPPRNYLGCGALLEAVAGRWTFRRRRETVVVEVEHVIHFQELADWADARPVMRRTEAELREKLIAGLPAALGVELVLVERERPVDAGSIDVVATGVDGVQYVIEVKRKTATLAACSQLERYVDCVAGERRGLLAAPAITANARRRLERLGFGWLQVDF